MAELSDVVLRVQLDAELRHQIQLRLQEVDVVLFIIHQCFEEIATYVIFDPMAMRCRSLVKCTGRQLCRQVCLKYFLDVLTDVQCIKRLHSRRTIEKNDTFDELIRVLHLLNRLFAPLLSQIKVSPIMQKTIMKPVLIY